MTVLFLLHTIQHPMQLTQLEYLFSYIYILSTQHHLGLFIIKMFSIDMQQFQFSPIPTLELELMHV